ncbi:hypothetical protein BKA57DRAFT_519681 [Linnemannia elongata]|nr:hypothetical protein BKA57DRAFT_519681 [Linnemannia elongata]
MFISKNLSALVVLAVMAVVSQVQASPVAATLEKRDTYGCPSTRIRCIYHCQNDFQPALQGIQKTPVPKDVVQSIVAYMINGGIREEARKINEKVCTAQGLSDEDECYKGYYQVLVDTFEPGFKDDRLQNQAKFSDKFPARMEFNMDADRLDKSAIPFCMRAHPTDVRLATQYAFDYFQEETALALWTRVKKLEEEEGKKFAVKDHHLL